MTIEVLNALKIELDGNYSPGPEYVSAYFPNDYTPEKRYGPSKSDEKLVEFFIAYDGKIRRIHIPPKNNLRNVQETTELLRVLKMSLRKAGKTYDGSNLGNYIEVDMHPGHSIDMLETQAKAELLNNYLENQRGPKIKCSVENIPGSSISSRMDIVDFARYIKDRILSNVSVTIDLEKLMTAESSGPESLEKLLTELKKENLEYVVSCLHAGKEHSEYVNNLYKGRHTDVQMVIEEH